MFSQPSLGTPRLWLVVVVDAAMLLSVVVDVGCRHWSWSRRMSWVGWLCVPSISGRQIIFSSFALCQNSRNVLEERSFIIRDESFHAWLIYRTSFKIFHHSIISSFICMSPVWSAASFTPKFNFTFEIFWHFANDFSHHPNKTTFSCFHAENLLFLNQFDDCSVNKL